MTQKKIGQDSTIYFFSINYKIWIISKEKKINQWLNLIPGQGSPKMPLFTGTVHSELVLHLKYEIKLINHDII